MEWFTCVPSYRHSVYDCIPIIGTGKFYLENAPIMSLCAFVTTPILEYLIVYIFAYIENLVTLASKCTSLWVFFNSSKSVFSSHSLETEGSECRHIWAIFSLMYSKSWNQITVIKTISVEEWEKLDMLD